jgi:MFS family permease
LQLFLSGVASAFFAPLLAALALSLVGNALLPKLMGENQAWNHAGNIASAALAIAVVAKLGIPALFYSVGIAACLAAASVFWIKPTELDPYCAAGRASEEADRVALRQLLTDRNTVVLFISVALFHFANAPILPAVAFQVRHKQKRRQGLPGGVSVHSKTLAISCWRCRSRT